jgi:hypothetical protein
MISYQQVGRYAALTVLISGAVIAGDGLAGGGVTVGRWLKVLLFTATLYVCGATIKWIWRRGPWKAQHPRRD